MYIQDAYQEFQLLASINMRKNQVYSASENETYYIDDELTVATT